MQPLKSNYLLFTQMCIEYTSLNFGYKNSIICQFHSLSIDTFAASYTMLTTLPRYAIKSRNLLQVTGRRRGVASY